MWAWSPTCVTRLPPGFRPVGVSDGAPFAAVADDTRGFYGLLFHPEVVHTPHGAALLRNFTHGVLGLSGTWTMVTFAWLRSTLTVRSFNTIPCSGMR